MTTALVWLRRDLRLHDNPALAHALEHYDNIIPVYLHGIEDEDCWRGGDASSCWLHHSLYSLSAAIAERGSRLILRQGEDAQALLDTLITESGAVAVFWNRLYEPLAIERDKRIKTELASRGIEVNSFNSNLLFEPWQVQKKDGGPFRVFTPFWRACVAAGLPSSNQTLEEALPAVDKNLVSLDIDALELIPELGWDEGFYEVITPGEDGAWQTLQDFLSAGVHDYSEGRDFPARQCTSRLSTHLHFGEICARRIITETTALKDAQPESAAEIAAFEREIGWREFAYHILFHYPHTTDAPMSEKFTDFPWQHDEELLRAWQRGMTGVPLVDAGMRELWHTGTMHNRVRMVVASYLTKNLLIHWKHGADWFRDTLIDYDLASNAMGWQWTAGSGADAAPYFRIFNPVSQSVKFDKQGEYLRRWVPEIAGLSDKHIHAPWEAPEADLEAAGVYTTHAYPEPLVDLKASRQRALQAWDIVKAG